MKRINLDLLSHYKNLKIKYKLIVFISIIMIVCLLFIIVGFQYAFTSYDEQIYRKSSQVLIMSSNRIEDELKRIEEVTYKVLTDQGIQNSLIKTKTDVTKYEQYQIERQIWEKLTYYVGSEKYIESIYLFDLNGTEYRAGGGKSAELKKYMGTIIRKAEEGNGSNVWLSLDASENSIVSTRQLKTYENLSLDKLGTIVIHVNLDEIINELPRVWDGEEGFIMISKGEKFFYTEKAFPHLEKLDFTINKKQGYQIQNIYGRSFFVTHSKSPYENWTYWNVIPFGSMFAKVTSIKFIVLFLFLTIFSVSIYMVIRFSKRITIPIENLVAVSKNVQQGDFKVVDSITFSQYQDEVGILHNNFFIMLERINELIKENYEKQLLIKDTEFKALQSQINPHFLYNTLESINWLAKTNGQQQISKMVESLGYLLRNAISLKEDVITLQEELEMVKHYVTIQKFRFEERLEFLLLIDEEVQQCVLPKLVIQPLVENAIHYALEMMIETCQITVTAHRKGDNLEILVEDNGIGIDEQRLDLLKAGKLKTQGNGIGLVNIEARIKFVFGDEYGLSITSERKKGTKVRLVIPYQMGWD